MGVSAISGDEVSPSGSGGKNKENPSLGVKAST